MNRPPIKKKCLLCEGLTGDFICSECGATGKVYNYLTPEQWETETGEKMLDSDPVWVLYAWYEKEPCCWELDNYGEWTTRNGGEVPVMIVARIGQPKPANLWRLE